jgi:hypothetical protein
MEDRVCHSTLPDYLASVLAELGAEGRAALPLRRGELRSPERAHLLPAVLSTRMWIKQWNTRCEVLLSHWAEPFSFLAARLVGAADQRDFLRLAWQWLLKNHPHDSICGCSVDQVHREMRTRFAWCEQIAEEVTQASLAAIAAQVDSPAPGSLVVSNPSAFARTDRVRARIRPTPSGAWHLLDDEAQPMPHRVLARQGREHSRTTLDRQGLIDWLNQVEADGGRCFVDMMLLGVAIEVQEDAACLEIQACYHREAPDPGADLTAILAPIWSLLQDKQIQHFHLHTVEDQGLDVEFLASDVPGLGYKQFFISPHPAPAPPAAAPSNTIDNEFFQVEADSTSGTLTVIDKTTGLVLRGINRFLQSTISSSTPRPSHPPSSARPTTWGPRSRSR